jgi:hypothetical protein
MQRDKRHKRNLGHLANTQDLLVDLDEVHQNQLLFQELHHLTKQAHVLHVAMEINRVQKKVV